jgi:hypothetical protein
VAGDWFSLWTSWSERRDNSYEPGALPSSALTSRLRVGGGMDSGVRFRAERSDQSDRDLGSLSAEDPCRRLRLIPGSVIHLGRDVFPAVQHV